MRIIALIDQASVYAYSREPLTVIGTFPGSANQGVYCVSCTGVAPRECRLHPRNVDFPEGRVVVVIDTFGSRETGAQE